MTQTDKSQEIHGNLIFILFTLPESVQPDKSGLSVPSMSLCCQVAGAFNLVYCWTILNKHAFEYYIYSHKRCHAPPPTTPDHSQTWSTTLISFYFKTLSAVTSGHKMQAHNSKYVSVVIILANPATFFQVDYKARWMLAHDLSAKGKMSQKNVWFAQEGASLCWQIWDWRWHLTTPITGSSLRLKLPHVLLVLPPSCNAWCQMPQGAEKNNPGGCNRVFEIGKMAEGNLVIKTAAQWGKEMCLNHCQQISSVWALHRPQLETKWKKYY